jgi:hypothetical protein
MTLRELSERLEDRPTAIGHSAARSRGTVGWMRSGRERAGRHRVVSGRGTRETPRVSTRLAGALGTVLLLAQVPPAAAGPSLVALDESGTFLVFDAERPDASRQVTPHVRGRLIGIDTRPADERLYGLSVTNDVYRVDPATGTAELLATLTVPFDGDVRSGVDFNPQADRLRLVSTGGQNLRVNVALGAVAVDRPLAYAPADRNAGRRPYITAAAYSNDVKDAPTTKLFDIDADTDALVLQDPPNDGVLVTIGPLGIDFGPLGGFDIVTEHGVDVAWAASGATLYGIDLGSGRATPMGTIGDGSRSIVALAVIPSPPAP